MFITLSEKMFLVECCTMVDAFDHVQRVSGQAHFPDPVRTVSGFPEGLWTVEKREPASNGGGVVQLLIKVLL